MTTIGRTGITVTALLSLLLAPGCSDEPDKQEEKTNPSATTARAAVTGTIVIQVIQTSKEGKSPEGDAVTLELVGQGGSEAKPPTMKTRVDANGVAVFEKIPLSPPLTPRVIVDHGGRTFEATSDVMSVVDIERTMTVMVDDTTDQAPAWKIPVRYVQVQPSPRGVLVITETFHVHNPTNRAYLSAPDDKGVRSSVILPLPAGIKEVTLGDGLRNNAKVVDGRIVSTAALRPGNSQFKVQYILPTKTNPTTVEIVAPARVGHLVVLVPRKGGVMLHAEGMKPGKVFSIGGKPWRSYIISNLARHARTALVVDAPALAKTENEDSVDTRMMCKCLMPGCGAEFVFDAEAERTLKGTGAAPTIRMPTYGCPKCKKAYCALVMTQCPKCKKQYLSDTVLHWYKVEVLAARGRDPSALGKAPPTICPDPDCKTDFNAWHRENRRKGGKR